MEKGGGEGGSGGGLHTRGRNHHHRTNQRVDAVATRGATRAEAEAAAAQRARRSVRTGRVVGALAGRGTRQRR